MKLPSTIRFLDEKLKESYYSLEKGDDRERELFKAIGKALDAIEIDAFSGIQIPKDLIPKSYTRQTGANNLWKYNLPQGWRLLYSIMHGEVIVVSLVLEWLNHNEYEKRFKY